MEALIADLGGAQKVAECRAQLLWKEAVGPALARQTRPLRVRRGCLEVAVPSAVWRAQLNFMQRDIILRLNQLLGTEVVRELKLLNQR